jgi:hypothetical protein
MSNLMRQKAIRGAARRAFVVGVLAVALGCSRSSTEPKDELVRVSECIASRRFEEALAALHRLELRGVQNEALADRICELRMVTLAGLGRSEELLRAAQACTGRRSGSLDVAVTGRAAMMLLAGGGTLDEARLLLDLADPTDADAISRLEEQLVRTAERLGLPRPPAAPPECPVCMDPECDVLSCLGMNCDFGKDALTSSAKP